MAKSVIPGKDSVWHSLNLECKPGFEEIISSVLFTSGFSGIEEHISDSGILLTAYIPATTELQSILAQLKTELNTLAKRTGSDVCRIVSVEDVPYTDWESEWRKGLGPVETGKLFVIRPSWTDYENNDGRIEIIIDPKMAFGTGGHATTVLCLEQMEQLDIHGKSILDAGCGSGVLSIAAAKLGAASVYGFDHDHFSVDNAHENIRNNGVNDVVIIEQSSLEVAKTGRHDVVFANMISGVLIPNLHLFHKFLTSAGCIVFSGILAEEEALFRDACTSTGFRIEKVAYRDEWIALLVYGAK